MDLGELETRAGQLISELSDIIQRLETDIGDPKKAISFGQVKEIEASIARMKKQGLPVPAELNELKIRLFSEQVRHQERIALYQKVKESIEGLLDRVTIRMPKRIQVGHANAVQLTHRKPYNYKKQLGSKGYSNVDDYLIPVIKLMWKGLDHRTAFREIAQKLDVRYNTVSAQCTRTLELKTEEFIRRVNSKTIVSLLKRKYPDQYQKITTELES